jgi:hypothetical protein
MTCSEKCVCPRCLEQLFKGNDQLAETYLKTRKLIEQREKNWIQQDKDREERREKKREETDLLLFRVDLELKRRGSVSSISEPTYSI